MSRKFMGVRAWPFFSVLAVGLVCLAAGCGKTEQPPDPVKVAGGEITLPKVIEKKKVDVPKGDSPKPKDEVKPKPKDEVLENPVKPGPALPPIAPERLVSLHKLIKPQPGEWGFADVAWEPSIAEARKKAAAGGKPLFIWYMVGEPLGQC